MFRKIVKSVYLFLRLILLFPFLILRKTGIPNTEIKKILLLRHDRIGDMVLSTTVFKALRIKYPTATITVSASCKNKDIIKCDPNIDEIFIYNGLFSYLKFFKNKKIDLAIDLFYTYELKQAFLIFLAFAKYRLGFENSGREVFFNIKGPGMKKEIHMLEHLLELMSSAGVKVDNSGPQLYLLQEEKAWAKNELLAQGIQPESLIIALHPGGFYPAQCWPQDKFAELAKEIIKSFPVKLIFFHEDKDALAGIKEKVGLEKIYIYSGLGLREFMAILNECSLLVCNNTGVLHIACALKIPTVSTMGPTDPILWRPYGQGHMVIRHELACSPCCLSSCSRHECMDAITVNEMFSAVSEQIQKLKNV